MLTFDEENDTAVILTPQTFDLAENIRKELAATGQAGEYSVEDVLKMYERDELINGMVCKPVEEEEEEQETITEDDVLCPICYKNARVCPWARERYDAIRAGLIPSTGKGKR